MSEVEIFTFKVVRRSIELLLWTVNKEEDGKQDEISYSLRRAEGIHAGSPPT